MRRGRDDGTTDDAARDAGFWPRIFVDGVPRQQGASGGGELRLERAPMANLNNRIGRIENAMRDLMGGKCQMCGGDPWAVLHVVHAPNGRGGFSPTGDRYLATPHESATLGMVTDDLCCTGCGAPAAQLHIM